MQTKVKPTNLLPLKNSLFCYHIWYNITRQTTSKEVMSQVFHIVQRIMISDHYIVLIFQYTIITEDWCTAILWEESSDKTTCTDRFPSCTVFTTDCMALQREKGLIE